MSLIDQHFEEALQDLPEQKLSWSANRRIRKMLMNRAREMEGRVSLWKIVHRLAVVPVAMVLVLMSTGTYGFYSPSVVRGDFLYPLKPEVEQLLYPQTGSSEERVAFHLWLSDRRYDEASEIVRRLGKDPLVLIPAARAQGSGQVDVTSSLDQALGDTLQSALQQQDYALLISGEIRDTARVKVVRTDIRRSIEKHKTFVDTITPALRKVKLRQKQEARQRKVRVIESVENAVAPATLSFDSIVEQPAEIETVAELLEDHLAFQQSILNSPEESADSSGAQDRPADLLDLDRQIDGDGAPVDKVSTRALEIHRQETERLLLEDLSKEPLNPSVEPVIEEKQPEDVSTTTPEQAVREEPKNEEPNVEVKSEDKTEVVIPSEELPNSEQEIKEPVRPPESTPLPPTEPPAVVTPELEKTLNVPEVRPEVRVEREETKRR